MLLEPLSKAKSIASMALTTERKGLETDEELEGTEGVEGRAEITKNLDAEADGEGNGAEGLVELESVVTLGGLVELREAVGVLAPVELARVDDYTGNGSAVAANPLGGGGNDDIGTVVNGAGKEAGSTKGVVDNKGNTGIVGDLGNGLEVGDVVAGVANGLDVDGLGLLVDGGSNGSWIVAVDKLGLDAEAGKEDLELVVGSAVEVGGRDNVVSGVGESSNGHELSGLAGRGGNGSNTTLEGSNTLLKDIDSGLWNVSQCGALGGAD